MDELRELSREELHERNIALINQRDAIKEAQRAIVRELDRRDLLEREAKQIAALPDEYRSRALAGADPELSDIVTRLVVDAAVPRPPAQVVAPEGVESTAAVGEPGRRRRWGR